MSIIKSFVRFQCMLAPQKDKLCGGQRESSMTATHVWDEAVCSAELITVELGVEEDAQRS